MLELTTTNFVKQVRGGASGTALELSDFARAYLRRTLQVGGDERALLMQRQRQLYLLGGGLQAAHALDPYAVDTIDVRGAGDYSAAKLLREALDAGQSGKSDDGLRLCAEAAELAPGYHEAARVEAYLHELTANFGEANEAYSRARDLAPDDPYVAYFFGSFLHRSGFDPSLGIKELQRAATLDPTSCFLQLAISDAHLEGGNARLAMDAAAYALERSERLTESRRDAAFVLLRSCCFATQEYVAVGNWEQVAEDVEFALTSIQNIDPTDLDIAALDYMLWLSHLASPGPLNSADDYIAKRLTRSIAEIDGLRREADAEHLVRRVGVVENLVERGFGFIASEDSHYFFHASSLWDRRQFDELQVGSTLVFAPGSARGDGKPPAESVQWVG